MSTFKASDARAIQAKSITAEKYRPAIDQMIKDAAHKGRCSIVMPYFEPLVMTALRRSLEDDGYKIIGHPDPDPGYPGSHPYTTVEW